MNDFTRTATPLGTTVLGRATAPSADPIEEPLPASRKVASADLSRSLAEVKGQAQFLLYLADQLEDSLEQLAEESDPGHATFLCKILGMYSAQLESKHVGLGDRISETCQEVYITVREHDAE
jgi:hypothetical protein